MKKPAAGKGCLTDDYGDENVGKIRYEYEVYRDRQKRMQSNFWWDRLAARQWSRGLVESRFGTHASKWGWGTTVPFQTPRKAGLLPSM